MQNPDLDNLEVKLIDLLPPLRLSVWRLIFEMVSSRESQTATSDLLFQISQIYLIESQFGTLSSSTDLMVTQYCFMLAFIESNPLPFPAFMDLLVERLASNPPQNTGLSNAPTRVIDSDLLDELAIIFDRLFDELDNISNRLLRLESLSEIMSLLNSISGSLLAQNQRLDQLALSIQEVHNYF